MLALSASFRRTSPLVLAPLIAAWVGFARVAYASKHDAAAAYEGARRTYFALRAGRDKQRYRHHWLKAIAAFRSVQTEYPGTSQAERAAYTTAELWSDLYAVSRLGSDLDHACDAYGDVVDGYARSPLADDALWQRTQLELAHRHDRRAAAASLARLLDRYPKGDMAARAKELAKTLPPVPSGQLAAQRRAPQGQTALVGRREEARIASVTEVKQWSTAAYSRVALYLSAPAQARSSTVAGEGGGQI
ncbi:MAG: hypothetical protein AAB426_05585, partial [Myxococcota bacterium]